MKVEKDTEEFYNSLADWVAVGEDMTWIVRRTQTLRQTHDSYVQNCREGFPHEDSVAGTRRLAFAMFGARESGEPYWSNNDRRNAGRGPMPIRGILRERRRQLARVAVPEGEESHV